MLLPTTTLAWRASAPEKGFLETTGARVLIRNLRPQTLDVDLRANNITNRFYLIRLSTNTNSTRSVGHFRGAREVTHGSDPRWVTSAPAAEKLHVRHDDQQKDK